MAAYGPRSYTMAAEAAAEIVSQKLEILSSCPELVGCLWMETLMKDAKSKLAKIREFFSARDRPSKSMEWSGRLLQAMYNAEEFVDKFHFKAACRRHEALHFATRPLAALLHWCILWRDLSNLVKAMKELCQDQYLTDKKEARGERKKEPASSSSHASAPWEGQKLARLTNFWDRQASMNFLCHETKKWDIMDHIRTKNEGVRAISIKGKQGAGKTYLARWVYREAVYLGFETAWVQVSAGMDQQEFLFEILKQVDKLARGVMDFNEIKKLLSQKLANTKRFLIVLDDVGPSDEELLDGLLKIIQPASSQGHIITTTRDPTIAFFYSDGDPIKLKKLREEESQRMLAMKLQRGPQVRSPTSEDDKIINWFPALPLYISLLGGLLAYEHGRAVLANDYSKMSVSDLLELSYHRLPVHLKPCFIYMALFPVAFPIPTRRLVRLWLADGLLDSHCYDRERERTRQPEDVGETFILELADRNVIDVVSWRADGSPKACQMLTSLYDMIRPIAMSTSFLHIHAPCMSKEGNNRDPTSHQQQLPVQPQERTKIRWLAEHTNMVTDDRSDSYANLNLGHVRSFLSFNLRRGMVTKNISTFLSKMTSETNYSLLRVLDLERVYKPSLQGVLCRLVLLRYLGLRSTVLDSIPSEFAGLHYLETLDIKHTNITSLPSSLWKARNLRHLHLNWFYIDSKKILKVCDDNVMALTKLQTLSGLVIGEVKENSMTGHMNSFTTLTTLKLFLQHSDNDNSGARGKTVARWISLGLTKLQSLTFGVIKEATPTEEAKPAEGAEPTKEATKVAQPPTGVKPGEEAQAAKQAKPEEEAKPAKGAEPTKVAQPPTGVKPGEEAQAAKQAKPEEEAKPAKGAEPTKEATKVAQPPKEANPAKSQIGLLPKLSLAQHHELLELYLLGQLDKPIWIQLLPGSLRVLTLSGSRVETDIMPELGRLLRSLRTFRLLANSFLDTSLTFVKDGFPSLKILKIWKLPQLERVIIDQGALPHLEELEFRYLQRLKTVEWINHCTELENIRVISQNDALVDQLKSVIGKKTNLHVEKDT